MVTIYTWWTYDSPHSISPVSSLSRKNDAASVLIGFTITKMGQERGSELDMC